MKARELSGADKRQLRHDHVLTRKRLIDVMIRRPETAEQTLLTAVACVVTAEEHVRLTALGETQEGWDRYIAAEVDVFDEQEGVPLIEHGVLLNRTTPINDDHSPVVGSLADPPASPGPGHTAFTADDRYDAG